jgi:multiple sugar transport system permease protein
MSKSASARAGRPAIGAAPTTLPSLTVWGIGVLKYATLVLGSIVALLPLLVIVLNSLKTDHEVGTSSPLAPPHDWFNFHNYVTAFNRGGMLTGFLNTTIILAVSLVGTIIFGSMTAYALDRFEFWLKKTILALFLLATLVPGVTTQVATFQVVHGLGLYDTRSAMIALSVGTDIISVYIFIQFLRGIPKELDEAAAIEGANILTIFWRIIFPLLKPAIATVVIIKGIAIYNEFYIPFLYMPDENLGVVSTSLFRFIGPFGAQWEVISAGVVIAILPSLVVFLLLQRFIYNGYTAGATK